MRGVFSQFRTLPKSGLGGTYEAQGIWVVSVSWRKALAMWKTDSARVLGPDHQICQQGVQDRAIPQEQ